MQAYRDKSSQSSERPDFRRAGAGETADIPARDPLPSCGDDGIRKEMVGIGSHYFAQLKSKNLFAYWNGA